MENKITIYNKTEKIEVALEKVEFKNVTAPKDFDGYYSRHHGLSLIVTGHCGDDTVNALSRARDAKDNIYNVKINGEYINSAKCSDIEYTFTYEDMELFEFNYSFDTILGFTFTLVLKGHKYIWQFFKQACL